MALRIGDTAPNFTIATTNGEINLHDWAAGKWVFFFSHPADFTPVCTTEMGRTSQLAPDFEARNCLPIGLSTDTVDEHLSWIEDVNTTQKTSLKFPIIADKDKKIAALYDMIHPSESNTATVRSVFIIDPKMKIRLTMTYPMAVGRNFDEIIRALDSIQLTDRMPDATPANWLPGEDVIVTMSVSDEDAEQKFGTIDSKLPYLRYVGEPK